MAGAGADREKAMRAVQAMFERYRLIAAKRPEHHVDFDSEVMNNLKIIDAGLDGAVTFELYVPLNFSNLNDVMHGGAAGVIFDMASARSRRATTSALAPLARPGYWEFVGGVTRALNISYLKAVPVAITVRLQSKVVSVGRQMALIQGAMTSLDGKVVYCTVEHHKVNAAVREQHRAVRIAWDDEFERDWGVRKASKM